MKQCVRCDREYPDSERFCAIDGAYLVSDKDDNQRPADLCPCCDGLSPGIDLDGETIIHCPICHDRHTVTPEQIKAYEDEMRARYGGEQ